MKIDIDYEKKCPKCGGVSIKPLGGLGNSYSCASIDTVTGKQCNHIFSPTSPYIGKRVRIRKPQNVWDGQKGTIEEITVNPKCPIRVRFKQGKSTMSDLFHPAHLEEV